MNPISSCKTGFPQRLDYKDDLKLKLDEYKVKLSLMA